MKKLNKILSISVLGIFMAGIAFASLGEYWSTVSHIIPRTDVTVDIGSATKKVREIWTNKFYGDYWISSTGNSMNIQPTGDLDDYFSFKTPAHRPTMKVEGGSRIYVESSDNAEVGIEYRKDASHSGAIIYYKNEELFGLTSQDSMVFKVCGDYDDYVKICNTSNVPEMSTVGAADFKINAGGANNLLLNHSGGNVGIGDATPAALLTVGDGDDFQVSSTGVVTFTGTGDIDLPANSIDEADLKAVNAPTDEYVLTYEATTGDFEWEVDQTGAGGSAIVFDIGDDGGNDSVDVNEIATTGDTNTIFTEPTADKILIAVGNNWPTADTATTASALVANPTDCGANQFAQSIVANGNLTCSAIGDADVPNNITIDLATTATTANAGDAAVDFFGAGVDAVTDATTCTDIEGTGLSITTSTLNWSSTGLTWAGNALTDAYVSDTLTCSDLVSAVAVVDMSTETNLTAGRSLTMSADSVVADSELYVFKAKAAFEDPVATDDFFFEEIATAVTFTSIYCKTLVGTVNLDITIAGTDINGTDITCNTTGVLDDSLGGDTAGAVGEEVALAITSVASSPTYIMVQLNGTYND